MRIGVDIDGVLFDFARTFRAWLGWNVRPSLDWAPLFDTWDLEDWLEKHIGEPFIPLYERFVRSYTFRDAHKFSNLIPGALWGLSSLVDAGHDVVLVTSRGTESMNDKAVRALISQTGDLVHVLAEALGKTLTIYSAKDKTKIDQPCDLYIEDAPHNVQQMVDAGKKVLYFQHSYNRKNPIQGAIPVHDWAEIVEQVERLSDL